MSTRPNILFIMSDDHAAKAISCYGHGINKTPNIDRLANEGMRLDRCYVSNSICTPSRASILTGTYNHVNGVMTLDDGINNRLPNVAKHLQTAGYQTAIIGKWHLGEGPEHQPTGFDHWSVLPGQGEYHDPVFHEASGEVQYEGYVTDVITDHSLAWLEQRQKDKPFFLMCHHKAPHRPWVNHPKYNTMFQEDIELPETFNDNYDNRASAAAAARMRIAEDLGYNDLGLVQPEGGAEVGEPLAHGMRERKLPNPDDLSTLRLIDKESGEVFKFKTQDEYNAFKYQRYMKRYLRTIASIDESVGRILDYLDENNLTENTLVIYTSDQGFFLGEHGWYDKRFIYEESFQMPFLVRYPKEIKPGMKCDEMVSNVDFSPTFLDIADSIVPNYMQGRSIRPLLNGKCPDDWPEIAYHRYWMHRDEFHDAYAHYGIRDKRYKLIYWYNQGYGIPGTQAGGEAPEWELFDYEKDPAELNNCYHDPAYKPVVEKMTRLLTEKMLSIGDNPAHL